MRATSPHEHATAPKTSAVTAMASAVWSERMKTIYIFVLSLLAIAQPHWLANSLHQQERIVILGGDNSYAVAGTVNFDQALPLHQTFAVDAAHALLMRGPKGFDRPDEVKRMFTTHILPKAQEQEQRQNPEFEAKQLHQKVEIFQVRSVADQDRAIVDLTGQLIRTGVFNGRAVSEAKEVQLQFTLVRNPNMLANRRYPLGVWEFTYAEK